MRTIDGEELATDELSALAHLCGPAAWRRRVREFRPVARGSLLGAAGAAQAEAVTEDPDMEDFLYLAGISEPVDTSTAIEEDTVESAAQKCTVIENALPSSVPEPSPEPAQSRPIPNVESSPMDIARKVLELSRATAPGAPPAQDKPKLTQKEIRSMIEEEQRRNADDKKQERRKADEQRRADEERRRAKAKEDEERRRAKAKDDERQRQADGRRKAKDIEERNAVAMKNAADAIRGAEGRSRDKEGRDRDRRRDTDDRAQEDRNKEIRRRADQVAEQLQRRSQQDQSSADSSARKRPRTSPDRGHAESSTPATSLAALLRGRSRGSVD